MPTAQAFPAPPASAPTCLKRLASSDPPCAAHGRGRSAPQVERRPAQRTATPAAGGPAHVQPPRSEPRVTPLRSDSARGAEGGQGPGAGSARGGGRGDDVWGQRRGRSRAPR